MVFIGGGGGGLWPLKREQGRQRAVGFENQPVTLPTLSSLSRAAPNKRPWAGKLCRFPVQNQCVSQRLTYFTCPKRFLLSVNQGVLGHPQIMLIKKQTLKFLSV